MALADAGAPIPDDDFIESLYGEPIPDICDALLPGAGEATRESFVRALRIRQAETVRTSAECYPGIPAALAVLAGTGWAMAVCSNAGVEYIELVTRATGIRGFFDELSGLEGGIGKAERIRDLALRAGGVAAVVGDRYIDIEAALECGLPSIGCLWGYGGPDELEGATEIASEPDRIPALLEQIRASRAGGSTAPTPLR